MDFCNFSRECDLYCFEQVEGGYVTLVAKNRPKFDRIAELKAESEAEFTEAVNKQIKTLMTHKVTARGIGLPADGQEFYDPDLPTLLDRVLSLQAMGYRVPAQVILDIKAGIGEG